MSTSSVKWLSWKPDLCPFLSPRISDTHSTPITKSGLLTGTMSASTWSLSVRTVVASFMTTTWTPTISLTTLPIPLVTSMKISILSFQIPAVLCISSLRGLKSPLSLVPSSSLALSLATPSSVSRSLRRITHSTTVRSTLPPPLSDRCKSRLTWNTELVCRSPLAIHLVLSTRPVSIKLATVSGTISTPTTTSSAENHLHVPTYNMHNSI